MTTRPCRRGSSRAGDRWCRILLDRPSSSLCQYPLGDPQCVGRNGQAWIYSARGRHEAAVGHVEIFAVPIAAIHVEDAFLWRGGAAQGAYGVREGIDQVAVAQQAARLAQYGFCFGQQVIAAATVGVAIGVLDL